MDMQKNFVSNGRPAGRPYILLFIFLLFFSLVGCATQHHGRIPVRELWHQPLKGTTSYVVQQGDTLYSIAWAFGLDYRQVAAANDIDAPAYRIEVGKKIILTAPASSKTVVAPQQQVVPSAVPSMQPIKSVQPQQAAITQQSVTAPAVTPVATQQPTMSAAPARAQFISVQTVQHDGIAWAWPTRGKLVCTFSASNLNKGIDIAGKSGAPVVAAASGKVVYASNGLRGYGLLIIIKHNDEYLSAYAHNQKLLVTEGQTVRAGQVIAKMGSTEARRVMLHFEIRKAGKPVDPLQYLPKR